MATACYTEQYLPASFKAVPFHATEVTSEHGRRGAVGEYPFGERTGYADTGRKVRRYNLRGRFQENSHVIDAAALIAVCELPGPGPLVHPTRGVIVSAACTSLKVTDKVEKDIGVTYVELEFVEADNVGNGLSLAGQVLGLAIAPLITSSRESFRASYAPTEIQTYRQDAVVSALQAQVANVTTAYTAATTDQATVAERNRIVYGLTSVVNLASEAEDITTADRALSLGMNATAIQLEGKEKFDVFRAIANGAAKFSTFASPANLSEEAVYSHVRVSAAAYMAEGALEATGLRASELFTMADIVDSVVAGEMEYARNQCKNELFLQLSEFRTSARARIYDKAYNAPGLAEFNFGGSVHPLKAAYQIHGDATRHRELEQANVITAGGRLSGSVIGSLV